MVEFFVGFISSDIINGKRVITISPIIVRNTITIWNLPNGSLKRIKFESMDYK